jgi:hypothetical protein
MFGYGDILNPHYDREHADVGMVDKIAHALYEANAAHVGQTWRELSYENCEPYRAMARAVISSFNVTEK